MTTSASRMASRSKALSRSCAWRPSISTTTFCLRNRKSRRRPGPADLGLGQRQPGPAGDREEQLLGLAFGDRRPGDVVPDDAAQQPAARAAAQTVVDFAERQVQLVVLGLVDRVLEQAALAEICEVDERAHRRCDPEAVDDDDVAGPQRARPMDGGFRPGPWRSFAP